MLIQTSLTLQLSKGTLKSQEVTSFYTSKRDNTADFKGGGDPHQNGGPTDTSALTNAALEVKHKHLLREGGGRAVCQRWGMAFDVHHFGGSGISPRPNVDEIEPQTQYVNLRIVSRPVIKSLRLKKFWCRLCDATSFLIPSQC